MKIIKKFVLIILFAFLAGISLTDPLQIFANDNEYSNYGATYRVKKVADERDLGYGVKYRREISTLATTQNGVTNSITLNHEYGQQVNVIDIDISQGAMLVPYAFMDGANWVTTTVRKAALQYEATNPGYRVVAAVNGDFFHINDVMKASTGVTISQGEYYKTINNHGGNHTLAIRNTGEGKQLFNTTATNGVPVLSIYDENDNIIKKIRIDKVNEEPGANEISLYYATRQIDWYQILDKQYASDVFYVKSALHAVTALKGSFYGIGKISNYSESEVEIYKNQFAVKSNNEEITKLLGEGVKIRCQYEFDDPSLEGIENFIGFPWTIIENGEVKNQDQYRHPRTIIGQKENGDIVLAVIDGRQTSKDMYGASCVELAAIMGYNDCVDAWNLDGGGSSTLIVRKQYGWDYQNGYRDDLSDTWYVTNSPSDGNERSDGNHLFVVVKLPDVKIDINNLGEDFISLNVVLLTELEKYKNLFVMVDGKYYPVENDLVKVEGLKKDRDYTFYLYAKIDDQYVDLMTSEVFSTNKSKPNSISVQVSKYDKNGTDQILIRYKVDNVEAVKNIILILGDERKLSASQTIILEKNEDFYNLIKDAKIEINYRVNDALPEEKLILESYDIKFDFMFIVEEQLFTANNFFKALFE